MTTLNEKPIRISETTSYTCRRINHPKFPIDLKEWNELCDVIDNIKDPHYCYSIFLSISLTAFGSLVQLLITKYSTINELWRIIILIFSSLLFFLIIFLAICMYEDSKNLKSTKEQVNVKIKEINGNIDVSKKH